jgi:hypothetical protein
MVDGMNGGNGTAGGNGTQGAGPEGAGEDDGDRLSAILPFLLAMAGDGSRKRGMGGALQLQLLFWALDVAIDGLGATKGVMERARERLKDIDLGRTDKEDPEGGAEW